MDPLEGYSPLQRAVWIATFSAAYASPRHSFRGAHELANDAAEDIGLLEKGRNIPSEEDERPF